MTTQAAHHEPPATRPELDHEAQLLGAYLACPAALYDHDVAPEHYRNRTHGIIHETIAAAVERHGPDVGVPQILELLLARPDRAVLLRTTRNGTALFDLYHQAPKPSQAGYYAEHVLKTAQRRKIWTIGDRLRQIAEGTEDVGDAIELAITAIAAVEDLPTPAAAGHTLPDSWRPFDLAAVLSGDSAEPHPTVLHRDDGHALLYPGKVHSVAGESESLKSWLCLIACAQEIDAGRPALYIDFEDNAESVTSRLLALGCARDTIPKLFTYLRPVEPIGHALPLLLALVREHQPTLVVIDGVTEGMVIHGLDPYGNPDAARWYALLARPLADAGPAVVLIDHVTKDKETRGRYAIGAQHKLAGLDGAAYTVDLIKPFGHGLVGLARVNVAKDRPGRVREHAGGTIAVELELTSSAAGAVTPRLTVPAGHDPERAFRPTIVMAKVSKILIDHRGAGLSKRAIRAAAKGKHDIVDLALETLVAENFISLNEGPRRTITYSSIRPFRVDLAPLDTPPDDLDEPPADDPWEVDQ